MRGAWLLVWVGTLIPATALPCGNSYYREHDDEALLVRAEKDAQAGRYARVRRQLEEASFTGGLEKKRKELLALAYIRSGSPGRGVQTYRLLLKSKPNDTFLKTRLAEGLSRTKGGKEEAKALLEALAQEDAIADAEGHWVLASLRYSKHEDQGAQEALATCRKVGSPERCPELPARPPQS